MSCWLAKQSSLPQTQPVALVDFSAWHFPRMCHELLMAGERISWSQPTPPPVIWTAGQQSPLIQWEPVPALCRLLWEHMREHFADYRPLRHLVATQVQQRLRARR